MGIDYSAEENIGIEVDMGEFLEEPMDLLYRIPSNLHWWVAGNSYADEVTYYIGPAWSGDFVEQDWKKHKARTLEAIAELGLDTIGEFGLVGGLYVY